MTLAVTTDIFTVKTIYFFLKVVKGLNINWELWLGDSNSFVFIPVLFLTETVLFSSSLSQKHFITLLVTLSSPGWHLSRLKEVRAGAGAGARSRRWTSPVSRISMFGLERDGHCWAGLVRLSCTAAEISVETLSVSTRCTLYSILYIISYTHNSITLLHNNSSNYYLLSEVACCTLYI